MNGRILIASVATGVVVVAAAAGEFANVTHREQVRLDLGARTSADRFAGAWSHRDIHDLASAGRPADPVAASFKSTTAGLARAPDKVTLTSLTGERQGQRQPVRRLTVAHGATWAYPMPISLQRNSNEVWAVIAKEGSSMWAPGPERHGRLVATRTSRKHGEVLNR
jgi:hypothetical protein